MIYKSILRPLITYGCAVWGLSMSAKKLQKLQIFQNKILRITVTHHGMSETISFIVTSESIQFRPSFKIVQQNS
jgi:hypothetical protein